MGREQHDVGGAGGCEDVLAILVLVAGQTRARDDERRRAAEFRGLVRRPRRDELVERLGPQHAETPRLGQMVVRREARELEELLDRLGVDGLGLEGLVSPP